MALTIKQVASPSADWDAFVRRHPAWSFCHLSAWHGVMTRVFGHECPYLEARGDDGALQGVLPLVRLKSPVLGHYLVSMPFLNYGGPLGSGEAVQGLVAHAVKHARGSAQLQLRSRTQLPLDLEASHHKITVVLDLPAGDPDAAWKAFNGKLRSQIRRPQKAGVTVTFGREQVEPFFAVFARNMRDLGTPTQSRRLFETIADAFGDSVWFGCAYLEGIPVAAGCGFRWGDEFEMTWASALREYNAVSPNMLLYWSFIERAAREGVTRFNFGRCTPGGGTHRFKQQWGALDEALWWYGYPSIGTNATPSQHRGGYALASRLWKRLPLGVATAIGPRIVRYIP